MSGRVVVSIHDVAPSTFERSMALLGLVERHGIAATMLVVPGPWNGVRPADDPRFVRWLTGREADGHEVCLHGWSHAEPVRARGSARSRVARLIARGCAEFADLSEEEAHTRIVDGRSTLRAIGCDPVGISGSRATRSHRPEGQPGGLRPMAGRGERAIGISRQRSGAPRILRHRDQKEPHIVRSGRLSSRTSVG